MPWASARPQAGGRPVTHTDTSLGSRCVRDRQPGPRLQLSLRGSSPRASEGLSGSVIPLNPTTGKLFTAIHSNSALRL